MKVQGIDFVLLDKGITQNLDNRVNTSNIA